jgi:hypothetical protein
MELTPDESKLFLWVLQIEKETGSTSIETIFITVTAVDQAEAAQKLRDFLTTRTGVLKLEVAKAWLDKPAKLVAPIYGGVAMFSMNTTTTAIRIGDF